ncbi:MAG TPA: hypothetical protein PKN86_11925 [Candidatus Obscuribacter sp.]|nr:hypothetical protein [Candidatus Obscuribacter sp.]
MNKFTIKPVKTTAMLAALVLGLGTLASMTFVAQSNSALNEPNYWQSLEGEIGRLKESASTVNQDRRAARKLAALLRQNNEQDKAAEILRALWLKPAQPEEFVVDALELASLYTEMGAFDSAIESYEKILDFDRGRLKSKDPQLVRDYTNLAQCYYIKACACGDPQERSSYLEKARLTYITAKDKLALADFENAARKEQVRATIAENLALIAMDCKQPIN